MSSFQIRSNVLVLLLPFVGALSVQAFEPIQEQLLAQARGLSRGGIAPAFIFDLDETTLDSTPRRLAATQAIIPGLCWNHHFKWECERLQNLTVEDIYRVSNVYDNASILRSIGITNPEFAQLFDKPIVDEYLSGRHLDLDQPYRGADQFIRALRSVGVLIYYISSRFEDVQRDGSRRVLLRHGMLGYHETNDNLRLRPRGMASIDFKKKALRSVKVELSHMHEPAVVIGVYENEPENMNAMMEAFPQATGVFLNGACHLCSVPVNPAAHRVDRY